MAVAHVASAPLNEPAATTTGTITIPAGVAAGHDLYVLITVAALSVGLTVTDDDTGGNTWALLGAEPGSAYLLYWKKATSGTASKTVTIANAVDSVTAGLSAFSGGLASGDPTTNLAFESNISGNETHLGFTPSFADSMICFGVGSFEPLNLVTLMTCTDPGSLEPELWERGSTGGTDAYGIFTARIQGGGPTATGNFTWAQTNASTRSVAFAIQPALAFTATGASTLAGVTSAGSGTFIEAITGTGASTLAGVTSAGTGLFTGDAPPPSPGGGCCNGRRRCCRRDR